MRLINPFETAIKYCVMKKHDDNSYPKKLFYLPFIKLETVFSSAQITSTFQKSDPYYHGIFWGFFSSQYVQLLSSVDALGNWLWSFITSIAAYVFHFAIK